MIFVLSGLICNGDEIGMSTVLMKNGHVHVIDGLLCSMEGIIRQINVRRGRLKVKAQLSGRRKSNRARSSITESNINQ